MPGEQHVQSNQWTFLIPSPPRPTGVRDISIVAACPRHPSPRLLAGEARGKARVRGGRRDATAIRRGREEATPFCPQSEIDVSSLPSFLVPPSFSLRYPTHFSPKIQALTMTHTPSQSQREAIFIVSTLAKPVSQSVSPSVAAADIFSLIWNGSRVSASVHIGKEGSGGGGGGVCVRSGCTHRALLAAPIKTRPPTPRSPCQPLSCSSVPPHFANVPVSVKRPAREGKQTFRV